ncbi:MAG TPA: zf-HC2 domain-containing protein [Candidatus Aminicenantes bacterium]|nr:zf-HC2 domain-containing protein [Candidatus Aminicenantes bacterium]
MKTNCKKMRKWASLDLDDRLSLPLSQALEQHLTRCPACHAWRAQQEELVTLLATPVPSQLSPLFAHHLSQRITASRSPWSFPWLVLPKLRLLAMQAGTLLLFLGAIAAGFRFGAPPRPPAAGNGTLVFNRTLNLELFADLPVDSFGAVYAALLQGGRP